MKLARYVGQGRIEICEESGPQTPPGGLLVRTEASGLCSGELMEWYMDRKIPHVLGHEAAGIVTESNDSRFPVGARVAPHHHAPCGTCSRCLQGDFVHCPQWKRTKLLPGGMAESFTVPAENLSDTHRADTLRAADAALMEPLACVMKSIRRLQPQGKIAVIGLGSMGIMHMLMLRSYEPVGIEVSPVRRKWAEELGFQVMDADVDERFDSIVVCPGSESALELAMQAANPTARLLLFAPMPPLAKIAPDWDRLYFDEISLIPSYSCGPDDMAEANAAIRGGKLKAEQVVSHFIGIDELPLAYEAMKKGEILKAMVMFE